MPVGGRLRVTVGLVDVEAERRGEAVPETLTEDVFDAEAERVAVREAVEDREGAGEVVGAAEAEPRPSPPPPLPVGVAEGVCVGAGAPDRVPVPLTVGEPRLVTVGEPLDERVLVLVTERDGVEDTLGQREPTAVRLPVEETRAVPVRRADAVALGDAEGVLDPDMLREPVAQLVGLREDVVEDVVVFDGGAVREPVPHADAVRVADMVRVPLGEPEGDFDADMDPVAVALRLPVPDSRADSEKEGEPVDVFDAVTVREPVGVPEPVLLALAERLGEGVPVDVREVDTEADAVLVGATVRVEVVLPVAVFEPAVDAVSAGEEDAVLEEDVVFVAVMDAVVVFVEV